MPFLDDLLYVAAFGSAPPQGQQPSNVQQSQLVALADLAAVLEKYDKTGDARELREWKQQKELQAELLKAKTDLLKAGMEGASREAVARISGNSQVLASKIKQYSDLANAGYDRAYGQQANRVMQDTANFPPGPKTRRARWDNYLEGLDPEAPGLDLALAQGERMFGPITVSPKNEARRERVVQSAAGQKARRAELEGAIGEIPTVGGGSGSMAAAERALALLDQDYALGKQESAAVAEDKERQLKNLERIQDSYDSLSAKVFQADKLSQYGGMTEQQWKYVIDSPRFKRFSQEYGFKVGSVDADGNYRPGKQDYRAVAAFVRAEAGRKVVGTPDRMERTLAAFNVQGGATPDGYAWEDGKFRVGPDGAYLRPEDGRHLQAGLPAHDDILLTDAKGNGYARDAAGAIYWLNPGSGTTTLLRTPEGKWVKGDPARFEKDVAEQEAAGLTWRPFADAGGGPPLSKDEVARRLNQEDGRGLDTLTDDDALMTREDPLKDFQVVDAGPQGTHAIYGRVLPHKPTDDDDTVRISTIGGVKVLHRTTDPATGEDVWQAEGDTQFTLPGGATVLSGGGTRTTLKERVQANRGARDERQARAAAGASMPEKPVSPEPPPVDKAQRVADAKAKLIASMEEAASRPKVAPYVPPDPPPDVKPGSPEALAYLKQKRLDEVKQALIQTMSGNPTLPPGKTLPVEEPAPAQAAAAEEKQRALVAALMRQKQAAANPAGG